MNGLGLAGPATLFLALLVGGHAAPPQDEGPAGIQSYVTVTGDRARLLNLADEKGVVVASPAKGDVLGVHPAGPGGAGIEGWLAVEVPGGFPAWVFGRYLAETDVEGVYEVTGNAVNMRPRPSSDVTHFPLPQRLHAGDQVRVIEVLDEGKPLGETWARIWTPPGVWAWIRSEDTTALEGEGVGATQWREALAVSSEERLPPPAAVKKPAQAEQKAKAAQAAKDEARTALDAAQELLSSESKEDAPDFATVRFAIASVLEMAPNGPIALEANETLRRIDALEDAARVRAQLLAERERRAQLALAEQTKVWEASKKKDPLGGVFLARGALYRQVDGEQVPRYYLRFGGETVCELYCSTGRYDLEMFVGYEIGVQGTELLTVEPASAIPVELSRVEILKRR